MMRNAVLVCGFVLAGALAAAAQTTQGSQPGKSDAVVHDGKPMSEWVKALNDDNPETRLKAARALVAIGEPAYPALSEALSDSYKPVWKNTVESLVKIGEPAVPALLAAIRLERSGDLRHNGGIAALQEMGAAAHPALRKALDDKDADVRMSAAVALRLQMMGRGQEAVIKLLGDVLRTNKDVRVRLTAVEALGFSGMMAPPSEAAVAALIPALKDSEADVQGMAAVSLVRLNAWRGQEVVPALINALKSKEEEGMLPSFAAEALGQLGPAAEAAIPALIETTKQDQPFIADQATEALGKIGPAAVAALRELLNNSTGSVRAHAAKALGSAGAGAEDTIPKLLESLKQDDPSVRAAAARALGEAQADGDEVIAALTKALADKNRDVRNAAIRTLGRIGSKAKPAVPALAKLLGELENFEQAAVVRTLGSIGPGAKEAIPAMEAALADGGIEAGKNLARIGPAAVPTLIKALKSEDPDVRQAAAWGLHYLGPDAREAVPALAALVQKDEKACNFAMQALGQIGPGAASAVPALVAVLQDGDKQLQNWALDTLREIGPGAKQAKDAVLKAMDTDDADRRWEAATALIAMGEAEAGLPIILKPLEEGDSRRGIGSCMALSRAGPKAKSAASVVIGTMKNEKADLWLRLECAKALIAIAPDDDRGVVFLREQASNAESPLSMEAALTLAELRKADAAAIARLKSGLDAKDPRVIGVCAGALAQVESERDTAIHLLQEKLQEKDPQARVSAALALANAGVADSVVVRILAGELRKEDGTGREMDAIRALGKIMRENTEARAVVEEALHAESDAVRAAARVAINGDQK